jgi:hypothetical protein
MTLWHVAPDADYYDSMTYVRTADGTLVCRCEGADYATRIVACHNACDGYTLVNGSWVKTHEPNARVRAAELEVVGAAVRLVDWVRLNHPHAVRAPEQDAIDAVDRLEDAMKAQEAAERKAARKAARKVAGNGVKR